MTTGQETAATARGASSADMVEHLPAQDLRRQQARRARLQRAVAWVSPLLFLLLWEAASRFGWIDSRFFPAPSVVAETIVVEFTEGGMATDTLVSLRRVGVGYLLGALPALSLGLLMGLSRSLHAAVMPVVNAMYPIPKSAVAPLLLLIFGFGEASKWVLVALGVFFPVLFNTLAGVINIDRVYLDVARNYGASGWQTLRTVLLPGAIAMILTGLRLGIGMAFILIAIAEMIGAREGLGYVLVHSWTLFQVNTMYAALVVIGVIGLLAQAVFDLLERWLVPWGQSQRM